MTKPSFKIEGIIIPMVTPFDRNEEVDEPALRRYTDWLIRQGVHALFTGSGCGEVWKLTTEQKKRMLEVVVEAAAGRVPVLMGASEGSTRATIELTRFSRQCGANGCILWPPYFAGAGYSDDTIVDHFRAVADASDIPVILYDAPEMCGYSMSADLIVRLAEIESIVGLKDSSGQVASFLHKMTLTRGRLAMFQGWDILLLPSLLMGADGGISSRANVAPRFMVELYAKARAGAVAEAQAMQVKLQALCTSKLLKVDLWQMMKTGLALQGMPVGDVGRPRFSPPFGEAAVAELRQRLKDLGVTTDARKAV